MLIPLSLKILGAILLAIFISFFILKRKKFLWPVLIIVVGLTVWQIIYQWNRSNPDLSKMTPDVKISATALFHDYESNDSLANKKYFGKIIELTGNVKEIKLDEKGYYTVILGNTTNRTSAMCAMDTVHQLDAKKLTTGSSAIIRGACTGFRKDDTGLGLGSDVILNYSVIVQKKN